MLSNQIPQRTLICAALLACFAATAQDELYDDFVMGSFKPAQKKTQPVAATGSAPAVIRAAKAKERPVVVAMSATAGDPAVISDALEPPAAVATPVRSSVAIPDGPAASSVSPSPVRSTASAVVAATPEGGLVFMPGPVPERSVMPSGPAPLAAPVGPVEPIVVSTPAPAPLPVVPIPPKVAPVAPAATPVSPSTCCVPPLPPTIVQAPPAQAPAPLLELGKPGVPVQLVVVPKKTAQPTPAAKSVVMPPPVVVAGSAVAPTPTPPVVVAGSAVAPTPTPPAPSPRAEVMPGLGVMPGDLLDNRIKSIKVGTDRNELVYISLSQLNKISTPYENPQAIDSTGAMLKAVGQDIYILPSSDKPLTVYVTNGGQGQSVGLTLVPKTNIPAQTVVLQMDVPTPASNSPVRAEADVPLAGDYVARLNGLMRTVALGGTPSGFTRSRLPASLVGNKDLVIEPQYKYSGSSYDLFSYQVKLISANPAELKEEAFYTPSVRAVAFYPTSVLQQGQTTNVYVISDRPLEGSRR